MPEEAKKQEALRLAEARRQEEEKRIAKKKEIQAVLINSLILGVIISAGVFLFKWISSQKKSERSSGELKNIAAPQPAAAVTFEAALEKLFTDPKDFRSYLRIKELMDAGEYEKALNIYGLKTGRLTEADKINLFEINLRLNKAQNQHSCV